MFCLLFFLLLLLVWFVGREDVEEKRKKKDRSGCVKRLATLLFQLPHEGLRKHSNKCSGMFRGARRDGETEKRFSPWSE